MGRCESAKIVKIIEVKFVKGSGVKNDPTHEVTEYWTLDGVKIAEIDEWAKLNSEPKNEDIPDLVNAENNCRNRLIDCCFNNIEAERARCGMTVEVLTNHLGVTRKTYYNWCNKGSIPREKLEKMADLFETTTDYLLGHTIVKSA
ncbi:MAG: helix-turn-helix transcriptional regulator [Oscillospiraceae bacterium]|nr:helix-turn-helix transcriptional regulator [Oscillospiraceae bacterium]